MILRRAYVCCKYTSRHVQRQTAAIHTSTRISQSQRTSPQSARLSADELESLFSKPVWSVETLLPPSERAPDAPRITAQQLLHLHRLSALPPPSSQAEQDRILSTLSDQLHFVGKMQQVDTIGVKPLRAIRDETAATEQEQTITLETLKGALAKEKIIGKYHKRIQRDTTPIEPSDVEDWDVLGSAERKVGKYFVVESERPQE